MAKRKNISTDCAFCGESIEDGYKIVNVWGMTDHGVRWLLGKKMCRNCQQEHREYLISSGYVLT